MSRARLRRPRSAPRRRAPAPPGLAPMVPALPGAHWGTVCGVDSDGRVQVEYNGQYALADSLVPVAPDDSGRRCALVFADGDPTRPVLLGLLWEPGRALTLSATERLVLRCGEASLDLHADGRVRLKGNTLTSQAYGANRILGGSVHLN